MPANPRSVELLDIVDTLLRELGEAIHYKTLTEVLVSSGLWDKPWGAEPDQILYSLLHNDVKRCGQGAGRFLFMGKGIFCTAFVEGLEHVVEELPIPEHNVTERNKYARPGDMPGDAEERRRVAEAAESNRRCGNCTSISYDGPNLHTHEIGGCSRYAESRRACVFPKSEACPLWKRRTAAQVNDDRITPITLISEAEHIRVTGMRYDAAKTKMAKK